MGKKIIGIMIVGLVLSLVIPVGSAYADYDCKLSAVGFIRIDKANSMIRGFVFFGDNDGETLRFEFIRIQYDDARIPMVVASAMPLFVHNIKYNPST
jgi:hypothetical protein